MKAVILTHNVSNKEVLINWDSVLFAAGTENNFGDTYTEVAFSGGEGNAAGAIPVKQTPEEILSLLSEGK